MTEFEADRLGDDARHPPKWRYPYDGLDAARAGAERYRQIAIELYGHVRELHRKISGLTLTALNLRGEVATLRARLERYE